MYVSLINSPTFSEYLTSLSSNICLHNRHYVAWRAFKFFNCINPNPEGRYFVLFSKGSTFISFTEIEAFGTLIEDRNFQELETIYAVPESNSYYVSDYLILEFAANIIDGSFHYYKESLSRRSCSSISSSTESHMAIYLKKTYKVRRIIVIVGETKGKNL